MSDGMDRRDTLISALAVAGASMIPISLQAAETAAKNAGSVEDRASRLNAALDVTNLMGKYVPLYHAGYYRDLEALFALTQPDVRVEVRGTGKWTGAEGVHKAIVLIPEWIDRNFDAALRKEFPNILLEHRAGRQFEMPLTSPVIRVAQDQKTAKGLWSGFGFQTAVGPDGKVDSYMAATKYAVDFIREGDAWKFWHFQIVPVFFTAYQRNWLDTARNPEPAPAYLKGELAPSESSSAPAHAYDPAPPLRYASFGDTFSY